MIALQDFISETLVQIMTGVNKAQSEVAQLGGMINPVGADFTGGHLHWNEGGELNHGQVIEFDIAVVATEDKGIKGGISVPTILGYEAKKESNNSMVSRIKFSIPVFLPQQKIDGFPRKVPLGY